MTRYLLFFLTGFAHALLILLYTDLDTGGSIRYRSLGLVSALLLFAFASWFTLFSVRGGALVAMLCLMVLLYWNVMVIMKTTTQDMAFDTLVALIHVVLSGLTFIAQVTCLRYIFRSSLPWAKGTPRPGLAFKVVLSAIPLTLGAAYLMYA
jgi:hypothetical protein